MSVEARSIYCPYCGESLEVLIDPSDAQQQYIEDCQVCCRPIDFFIGVEANGEMTVRVAHEND